jgi:hypothetical protein
MRPLGRLKTLRRFVQVACLVSAALCNLPNARAGFSFTPGYIYSTWTFGNTTNVVEYSADGTFLDSLTIPSLLQDDELRGIAFGPDGLLYAVIVHFADSGSYLASGSLCFPDVRALGFSACRSHSDSTN